MSELRPLDPDAVVGCLRGASGKWREAPQPAVPLAWWAIPLRNLVFFLVVLVHLFRRLLPPY